MELQILPFWILKEQSTINSANEYEPDVLNTWYWMYELISAFATQKFTYITPKELSISLCIKFH